MTHTIDIANDSWRVRLNPAGGGSVLSAATRVGDAWVDVLRPTPTAAENVPADTASYPLAPWSNRIRAGALPWQGTTHQLRINFPDGTAIHGTAMEFPWEVVEHTANHAVLEFDSRGYVGVNFPWDFVARFSYTVDGPEFHWDMSVINVDHVTFPAGIGHHPYFMRTLITAAGQRLSEPAHLQVNASKGYALTDCMPDGPAGEVPAHADFRSLRPLGETFVDDCYTDMAKPTAAVIEYPGALRIAVDVSESLDHMVVYIPVGEDFFAVEAVSNANDGFALFDRGIDGTGVQVLQPGDEVSGRFTLRAEDL